MECIHAFFGIRFYILLFLDEVRRCRWVVGSGVVIPSFIFCLDLFYFLLIWICVRFLASCSLFFSICFILFFLATMLYQSPESFLTTIFYYFFCECKISECGWKFGSFDGDCDFLKTLSTEVSAHRVTSPWVECKVQSEGVRACMWVWGTNNLKPGCLATPL